VLPPGKALPGSAFWEGPAEWLVPRLVNSGKVASLLGNFELVARLLRVVAAVAFEGVAVVGRVVAAAEVGGAGMPPLTAQRSMLPMIKPYEKPFLGRFRCK